MAEFYTLEKETLTNIADAIRLKRDITDEITPEDMPMQIGLIDGGIREYKVSVLGDGSTHGATSPLQINVPFKPIAFEGHLRNYEQALDVNHTLSGFWFGDIVSFSTQRSAGSTAIFNGGFVNMNIGQIMTDSNTQLISYSDGVASVGITGTSGIMANGEYYDFTFWG